MDMKNLLEKEQEKTLRLELEKTQAEEGRLHVERQLAALQETLDQVRRLAQLRVQAISYENVDSESKRKLFHEMKHILPFIYLLEI